MKKLILFGLVLMMASCLGTKKVLETKAISKENLKTEIVSDSASHVTINKAIDDKIATKIPETGDTAMDERIDEILAKINTSKSSGGNAYKLYYDKKTRELVAELKIGATKDSISTASSSLIVEKTTEELITEYSKTIKNMIPWWLYVVAAFFLLPHVVKVLGIFNPVVGLVRNRFKK